MPIETEAELEQAVTRFQELRHAPDESPDAAARTQLDAEIKAYYQRNAEDLRMAKPPR